MFETRNVALMESEKVTISSLKYDALVAKAERLRIVEDIVRSEKDTFGNFNDLRRVLGMEAIGLNHGTEKGGADDGEIPMPM